MDLTFRLVQEWVEKFEQARGWADRPPEEKFICLQEEIGELAHVIKQVWTRSSELIKKGVDPEESRRTALDETSKEVAEEIVDCIIYLLSVANKFRINIDSHLNNRMKLLEGRRWVAEHALKTGFK
jgi:NTP pyrophosphatase (non-canonical NTP hydrolase)